VTKDDDPSVAAAKLFRQQLEAARKLGQELKRRGLLPEMDLALFRSPRLQDLGRLKRKPKMSERARKQAAVREIARLLGGVPPRMSTAKFIRECVDIYWPLVAPRHGLDPEFKTAHAVDWHTANRAIGREV
jgi:hypothetical protein